jgi:perosamine synthetase
MMINYGRQKIEQADIDAVVSVLQGDWLTQGPVVESFERAVADYVGARFAVAFSNGTAALHGAAFAAGMGPGKTVFTSPLTFMASANAARFVGASPALVDIDPETLNIDLEQLPDRYDAVVPVHFAGLPVDLSVLNSESCVVIEDAAHALGAKTPDGPVGNCVHSDMTCFSFHPVKPITTGEGGMVTTNDENYASRLREFRSHGIIRKPELGGWYYEIEELGYNYRLTDIQCALGLSQLSHLDRFIERRNEIASRYREVLKELPLELPPSAPDGFLHGYHLFVIQVDNRREVFEALRRAGIGVQVHYVPVHHHPISRDIGLGRGDLPHCDRYYDRAISLPIYPGLSDEEQDRVVEVLRAALSG